MPFTPYIDIEPNFDGLSRKEQYELLLKTVEWNEFRLKIFERDNHCCVHCGKKEGLITKKIPDEELLKLIENDKLVHYKCMVTLFEENYGIKLGDYEKERMWKKTQQAQTHRTGERIVGEVVLNAHHKLYFWGKLPWNYDMIYLETLCTSCHSTVHKENKIVTYFDETRKLLFVEPICGRCDGLGYIIAYKHFHNGICFECWGRGTLFIENPNWSKC